MNPVKVSAIVSAYYAAEYISGRLINLRAQAAFEDHPLSGQLEIVVVAKEGSPEEEIAQAHREDLLHLSRNGGEGLMVQIKVVRTPDIPTVYAAWNLGIKASTGEYITNANSDDRHYPGALPALVKALDGPPRYKYDLAYFNVDRVEEIGGAPIGTFEWLEGGLQELYFQGCFLGPMPMWRRSVHDKIGYFDEAYTSAGDYEFWMRMAKAGCRFVKLAGEAQGAHLEKDDALEHRAPLRSTIESARARAKYRSEVEGR